MIKLVNINELRFKTLNFIMPSSFAYLVKGEEDGKYYDEKKLRIYTRYYERVVKYYPNSDAALSMLGFCYYNSEKSDEALKLYTKAFEINPRFFWHAYNLGIIYFQKGQYHKSIEFLKISLDADMQNSLKEFIKLEMLQPIIKVAVRSENDLVLKLEYRHMQIYQMLVLSCYNLNKIPEMIQYSSYGKKMQYPNQDFFNYYLGLGAYKLGQYDQAVKYLKKAVELNPDFYEAYNYLALTFDSMGDVMASNNLKLIANNLKKLHNDESSLLSDFRVSIF